MNDRSRQAIATRPVHEARRALDRAQNDLRWAEDQQRAAERIVDRAVLDLEVAEQVCRDLGFPIPEPLLALAP